MTTNWGWWDNDKHTMTMTIRQTMTMTIRRLQWTATEFGRDWTNWLNICVSCQALLAQVTWAVAFSLCWRFQPWTLSDFWKWWWTKRRRWRWQKFQSLEHLIVDVKTHSARKGKNRLYVCHIQSLSWRSPWCPSCQSWAGQRLLNFFRYWISLVFSTPHPWSIPSDAL